MNSYVNNPSVLFLQSFFLGLEHRRMKVELKKAQTKQYLLIWQPFLTVTQSISTHFHSFIHSNKFYQLILLQPVTIALLGTIKNLA